jgi:hypothetical protein
MRQRRTALPERVHADGRNNDPDRGRGERAMRAMLGMKIDIAALQATADADAW